MASGGARSEVARVPPLSTIMGKSLGCAVLLVCKVGESPQSLGSSRDHVNRARTLLEQDGNVGAVSLCPIDAI